MFHIAFIQPEASLTAIASTVCTTENNSKFNMNSNSDSLSVIPDQLMEIFQILPARSFVVPPMFHV